MMTCWSFLQLKYPTQNSSSASKHPCSSLAVQLRVTGLEKQHFPRSLLGSMWKKQQHVGADSEDETAQL